MFITGHTAEDIGVMHWMSMILLLFLPKLRLIVRMLTAVIKPTAGKLALKQNFYNQQHQRNEGIHATHLSVLTAIFQVDLE